VKYKLALIGFGNVAQGLAEILSSKASLLREKFDADISIVAICDLYFGSIADPGGLDPQALLDHIHDQGDLKEFPAPNKGWDAQATIGSSGANVLVELSFTDLKTGEPALSHMTQALTLGMNISTANVAPALCSQMQTACMKGDFAAAAEIQDRLMPLHMALFTEPSPAGAKYAASLLGLCGEYCRLPIVPLSQGAKSAIHAAMSGLDLI